MTSLQVLAGVRVVAEHLTSLTKRNDEDRQRAASGEEVRPDRKPRRRIRASLLLQCVILALSLGLFVAVFLVAQQYGMSLGKLALLVVVWFVGIEFGLLPRLLERWFARHVARHSKPVHSIWWVDLDYQMQRALAQFHQDTEENPTIR